MKIETDRLSIRPYQKRDYDCWLESYTQRHTPRNRHDDGPVDPAKLSLSFFENRIEKHKALAESDDTYHLGVFNKEETKHLGHIDFHIIKRENYSWAWIGYFIHNQHQDNGYGTEAVKAAIEEIGFKTLGLKRIEAIINIDNPASIKLAEKCGLKYECTKEKFIFEFGEWTDNHVYVILNDGAATL